MISMDLARKQVKNLCEPVAVRQTNIPFSHRKVPQFSGKAIGAPCAEKAEKGCPAGIFAKPIPVSASGCCECRQGGEDGEKMNKETKDMTQKKNGKQANLLLIVLCVVALAVAALFATGIIGGKKAPDTTAAIVKNGDAVGNGAIQFPFVIVDKEGNETAVTVKTDKKTVGEALLDEKIVEGEMGDYGLYVKKVNGISAIYEVDQTYWAFYIDGQYATTGIDMTDIQSGCTYMMKVEK